MSASSGAMTQLMIEASKMSERAIGETGIGDRPNERASERASERDGARRGRRVPEEGCGRDARAGGWLSPRI